MDLSRDSHCLVLPVGSRDHCQGNLTAKITLVEYGDYQCLACGEAHRIVQAIQQQLDEQIRFVFRHFPQSHFHPEAYHAAEAAEAAASQGKFWEMHAHLFEHQSKLEDSHLVEYAIALYLNVDQFLQEMAFDCHVARVRADIESGVQSGVIQTPTFFINGVKHHGDCTMEELLSAIGRASG